MPHAVKIDGANVPMGGAGPTISMSTVENIAARKFLRFALDDVRYQLEKMSADRSIRQAEFDEAKGGAMIVSAYIANLLQELDFAIEQAMKTQ